MSLRWPSVISNVSGRPSASTIMCTFVVRPPRERPIPSAAAPLSSRGVLVGAVDRAVQAVPFVIGIGPQGLEQAHPLASLRPAVKAVEHGLPWPELVRQIAPRNACTSPPQHRLDEAAVVCARAPSSRLRGQHCLHPNPLRVVDPGACRHARGLITPPIQRRLLGINAPQQIETTGAARPRVQALDRRIDLSRNLTSSSYKVCPIRET